MGLHDPFGSFTHKLWLKERSGVNLAIWLFTIKSQKSPWFPCIKVACHIHWKAFNEDYNFALDFIFIGGLYKKLWAPKITGVPISRNLGLQLGSLETKWHLGACPIARHREYYKGEGSGFPQVRAVVSLVSLCLLMVRPCTKSAPITH
jgi:hypothetical protein